MTRPPTKNVAASVRQRLLNLARERNQRFDDVLQHYVLERWLYRLSQSEYASVVVLKGGLMLVVWDVPITRPTRDIDLLVHAPNDPNTIREMVADICRTTVEDDGLVYDHSSVATVRIAEAAETEGVRATFTGQLGRARLAMRVDMGFSDVITPSPVKITYPTALGMPAPTLWAYNRETAVAEKFEAMVKIGDLNSRMKDFFDVWTLASGGRFDGATLAQAIQRTFDHRGTALDLTEAVFAESIAESGDKAVQWKAFLKRSQITDAPGTFAEVWSAVMGFLRPVAHALQLAEPFTMAWPPGGPWQRGGFSLSKPDQL